MTCIEDLIAEGERVVGRFIFRGTHTGKLMNISPTGKHVAMAGIMVFRLEHGKLAEGWILIDNLSIFRQLGVLPPAEPIGKQRKGGQ
jgi:predicted ester cyclase